MDDGSSKQVVEPKKRGEDMDRSMRIHAFDPNNVSMPDYSSKYKNEQNAGVVRHLLGGTGCLNQSDIRSSTVHWQLGLRAYKKIENKEEDD